MSSAPTPGHFSVAGREFPNISWWNKKNLRTTYLLLILAVLTSATNGYDGSMVNGLLSLDQFDDCKHICSSNRYIALT